MATALPGWLRMVEDEAVRALIEQEYYLDAALAWRMALTCTTAEEVRQMRRDYYGEPFSPRNESHTLRFCRWLQEE